MANHLITWLNIPAPRETGHLRSGTEVEGTEYSVYIEVHIEKQFFLFALTKLPPCSISKLVLGVAAIAMKEVSGVNPSFPPGEKKKGGDDWCCWGTSTSKHSLHTSWHIWRLSGPGEFGGCCLCHSSGGDSSQNAPRPSEEVRHTLTRSLVTSAGLLVDVV